MQWLRNYARHSPIWNFNKIRRDQWVQEVASSIPAGSRVLDIGAGSGPYREFFSHCTYQTQDFAQLSDEQLWGKSGYTKIDYVCDLTAIPLENGTIDVILCTEVLEHIAEPLKAIEEFSRLLKPGGQMILTVPLGSGLHQMPHHYYGGFTPYFFSRFLPELGFSSQTVTANQGLPSFFGQEAMRYLRETAPWKIRANLPIRVLWTIIWIQCCLPLLLFPLLAPLLERMVTDTTITVGYFIRAHKGGSGTA